MITTKTIEEYQILNGDVDMASKASLAPYFEEWDELDKLINRLKIINSGFASHDFEMETNKLLEQYQCETIEAIKRLSWKTR